MIIFSGAFCHGEEVADVVARSLGFDLMVDQAITSEASKRFETSENKIRRALAGQTSAFNKFTHEKERCIAYLKVVLADMLKKDSLLFFGSAGHLIPKNISHVLRVGLIAETKYRAQRAMDEQDLQENDAVKLIRKEDEKGILWINHLFQKDPWDADLYDMIIPMDKKNVDDAVRLILKNIKKDILEATPASRHAVDDFGLAAEVETVLGKEGHDVSVSAKRDRVTLTINKHVLRLSRLEDELKKIVMTISGVKEVETKVGPGYYKSDIYRKIDLNQPSRVVLVDDEQEYAQTLSERLLMRDMGAAVVYDGDQALSLVEKEEPEVMVIDLKMPGINGFEVLRRIKKEHPNVEVIVLTGHGSKEDEETCLKLGAFAYLEKPVDVEILAKTMRAAYRKVREQS
jgi:CheY-like chemotaxis protein/cytidylate kinase